MGGSLGKNYCDALGVTSEPTVEVIRETGSELVATGNFFRKPLATTGRGIAGFLQKRGRKAAWELDLLDFHRNVARALPEARIVGFPTEILRKKLLGRSKPSTFC